MTWRGEQESATAWQNGSDLSEQPALDLGAQQKEKAQGDYTIKCSPPEEV